MSFVSIEDVDLSKNAKGVSFEINSPRTLQACKILGLELSELEPVDKSSVVAYYQARERSKNVPHEYVELRFNMLNQRRFDKQKLIAEERKKLIENMATPRSRLVSQMKMS